MGSHILILQLSTQPLILGCHNSVPCCILCDQSADTYSHHPFTELRILVIVKTVQHLNNSAIKLYHHPFEGVIIGKGFYFRHHWVQKRWSLRDYVIWWMNGLADIIIADITAGQRKWCFTEIGSLRKNPLYGIYYLDDV